MDYEIPPEALEDEEFARMIQEAEKYLGVPMYGADILRPVLIVPDLSLMLSITVETDGTTGG